MAEFVTLQDVKEELANIAKKMVTPVRVTPDTAGAYHESLRDMSRETLRAALIYCVENSGGTFFPSIAQIREASRELISIAMGVPSSAEAWAMVLSAKTHIESIMCPVGAEIRDEAIANIHYARNVVRLREHEITCPICTGGGWALVYGHPAVAMTVRMIGGLDAIHTGMPTADRARFYEAYKEIVEREIRTSTQSATIKAFIQATQARYAIEAPAAIAGLIAKWSK